MTRDELYQNWTKQSNLVIVHKTLPDTKIQLVPAEIKRNEKHFVVRVKGQWILERKYIRPFRTLAEAWQAAEKATQA